MVKFMSKTGRLIPQHFLPCHGFSSIYRILFIILSQVFQTNKIINIPSTKYNIYAKESERTLAKKFPIATVSSPLFAIPVTIYPYSASRTCDWCGGASGGGCSSSQAPAPLVSFPCPAPWCHSYWHRVLGWCQHHVSVWGSHWQGCISFLITIS